MFCLCGIGVPQNHMLEVAPGESEQTSSAPLGRDASRPRYIHVSRHFQSIDTCTLHS
jgi:hypothetical protein